MILFPAIDLHMGRCVRLTHGLIEKAKVYSESPLEVAAAFVAQGAQWIHLVDLDAAMDHSLQNRPLIADLLRSVSIPVQVGGGVRTLEDADFFLGAGAARVIVGSMAVEQPLLLQSLTRIHRERVAVGVDVRNGEIAVRGWKSQVQLDLQQFLENLRQLGVQRIIFTDIQRDGALNGPALESTLSLARNASLRVIASGGVSTLEDLAAYRELGRGLLEGVVVGKALYEGRFTVTQAIEVLSSGQPETLAAPGHTTA